MKKSRIISLALTLALVLTTVFAGTEGVFAGTSMKAAADDAIAAVSLNGTASPQSYYINYSKDAPNEATVTIPSAGTFAFNFTEITGNTTIALYDTTDANADPVDYVTSTSTTSPQTWYVNVKKAGTYYLAFYTKDATACKSTFSVSYAPKTVSSPKLSKNYWAAATNGSYVYYKVKASSTGYITVSFPKGYDGDSSKYYVKLMNSSKSKNLLGNAVTVNYNRSFKTYAGVAKGTYYVAVKTSDKLYQINLKFNKVKENSGSSRTKAKGILKGSTKHGTILATQTSSSADWYKIKLNSTQSIQFDVNSKTGGTSGGVKVTLYYGSKTKAIGSTEYYYGKPGGELYLYNTDAYGNKSYSMSKGTYYIKVQKYGKGTGYYSIKWK